MKIALIADTHFGHRNDSPIFLTQFCNFFDTVFFPTLDQHGITTVIHLGDLVDRRKYINFQVLATMRETFLSRMCDRGISCHYLVGNHDTPYRNNNNPNAISELAGWYPNAHVYSHPTDILIDDMRIAMIPWIHSGNQQETMEFIKTSKAQILMGHIEIQGFEMHSGEYCKDGLDAQLFSTYDQVFSGHFHHKSSLGSIHYLGSPYEMNFGDMGEERGFHLFDTQTRQLEFIANPFTMFHRMYYDDAGKSFKNVVQRDFSCVTGKYVKVIVERKTNDVWYDKFLDRLNEANPAFLSCVQLNGGVLVDELALAVDETKDSLTLVKDYVDTMEDYPTEYKTDLKTVMQSLYSEALAQDHSHIG